MTENPKQKPDYPELSRQIKVWAREAGFADARVGPANLPPEAERKLEAWLAAGYHGEMDYMARHGALRVKPAELVPGTLSVISVRMNYWPGGRDPEAVLADGSRAYLSRYALGRDYHKVLRNRLQKLAERIEAAIGAFGYRVFTDSAPVAEVALASQAGLGWRGKHTLLLTKKQGSLFFLGEILTDLPLPADEPEDGHCGRCTRCIDICPTQAIVEPYTVDARRCISYLTIELKSAIPEAMRPLIGNRVYGCDDCQLTCPWNRFAVDSAEADFAVRHGLDDAALTELFAWSEAEFKERMAGSPIYRIGYAKWLSNLAVGLGNAPTTDETVAALRARLDHPDELVAEPVRWALARHGFAE
ncbi:tRNA epoxyqueuosine(34) reductase QueG [Xenophilus sp. AP218F]|nr:tRNA epoxyqueuosine(34) reductase QueG [Chromobacterium sp. ASV5]OWY37601.1 tRNA epoxyqueuosine(34) reductase QueG [Xenophilus sp. AP218F]